MMARLWHSYAMPRVRVSTTVDEGLLSRARDIAPGTTDAALIDDALAALLARNRAEQLDAAYTAYDDQPLDEADDWGDLASFREAAGST
jgi:hypothetical protein